MQIGNLKLGAGEGEGTAPDRQQEPHKLEKSEKQRNNTPGAKKDPAKKKSKRWASLQEIYALHVRARKKDSATALTFD